MYSQSVYHILWTATTLADKYRYRKYAGSKWRPLDEAFISSIDARDIKSSMKLIECTAIQSGKKPALPTPPGSDGFQDWDSF